MGGKNLGGRFFAVHPSCLFGSLGVMLVRAFLPEGGQNLWNKEEAFAL